MANIYNYKSHADYLAATDRPKQQSSVSYDGSEAQYDGVNVVVPFCAEYAEDGDMFIYDTVEGCRKLLKWRTYEAGSFDSSRYLMGKALYFGAYDGLLYGVADHALGNYTWAEGSYFRLTGLDLTQAGSFTFRSYHGWADHTGLVISWEAGATYADLVAQMNASAVTHGYFKPAVLSDGTGIGIDVEYPTIADVSRIFSLTATSGGAEGASVEYMNQYNGADVVLQYVETPKIIPGRKPCKSVLRRSGLFTSWGGLTERFYDYYSVNGSATFQNEKSSTNPMSKAGFEALATSTDATAKAMYDKYNGDYRLYIEGQKIVRDTARGIIGVSDGDVAEQTNLLANVMTRDYNNNPIPAFPAFYQIGHYGIDTPGVTTGFETGMWGLPPARQLADLMPKVGYNSNSKTDLNKAFDKFNSAGNLYSSQYLWSSAEYAAHDGYFYYGYGGYFLNTGKPATLGVRGVLALPALKP